ncbi:MAG TPA: hypothetical protein DDX39_03970 [Bacteroidales bacterium]|nr:MAG: hypothetical protein A2W98_09130 [Bacteroidetes bacterium GWF2_33_38]HBF87778.1 hypothetical protein [Bacteroidales bacterium]
MQKKIGLLFIFIVSVVLISAQNLHVLDSLNKIIKSQAHDTIKIKTQFLFGCELADSNPDSANTVFNQILTNCLEKQKQKSNKFYEIFEAHALKKLGYVAFLKGNYPSSLERYLSSLKKFEKLNIYNEQAYVSQYIGLVHHYQSPETFDEAYVWYKKSKKLMIQVGDKLGNARVNRDIGSLFSDPISLEFFNIDSALYYYKISYAVISEIGEPDEIAGFDLILSWLMLENGDYKGAIEKINKSHEYFIKVNNEFGIFSCIRALASVNAKMNNFDEAEKLYLTALKMAEKIQHLDGINNIYESLSIVKSDQKDYKKAMEYYKFSVETKFKIYSQEKINAMTEMQTKYETEKKELEIENLNKEKEIQNQVVEKQMVLIYSFILGFLIVLVFSIIITKQYSDKRKANFKLAQQNTEISQQKEEISAQRDEIETQRDEIAKHRDLVIEQKDEIESSINYAKRIQNAVLPDSEILKMILGEHFILFKPKDIVSGDFYWATIFKNWQIFTVADCTGHGVPGAFMSMLGISFINEIVRKEEIIQANQILHHLRIRIINSLQQKGVSGEQKDGMDISMCVLNLETQTLQYAGANNPLWIVKSEELKVKSEELRGESEKLKVKSNELQVESSSSYKVDEKINSDFINFTNFQLYELKGDKMPIAIYLKMDEFTNHEIEINKGDCLYLISDGYEDQFGGSKGKKFMSKNLKQLFIDNCHLSMNEQKEVLEKTLTDWIGDGEQIDDITVMGIKI